MNEPEVDPPSVPTHRIAGRYFVRRELGRGMMGVVYEAEDTVLGRTVAVKTIELAFDPSATAREEFELRFFTEARVAAKLAHPGIVVCHDVGKDPESGKLFIVFEHLKGRTLAERIAGSRLGWREGIAIVAKVAHAIQHAHEHGVIHRDLKPANVMLLDVGAATRTPSSDDTAIKIMDFGVAKMESVRVRLTAAGQSFGSPLYMSPEQAQGHWSDARSDIFSVGSILCTVLLGRPWFEAPNIPKILGRVVHDDAPAVSTIVHGLPPALDRVIARALAKPLEARYAAAADLADDLEDILAGREPRHVSGWTVSAVPLGLKHEDDPLLAELTTRVHARTAVEIDPASVRTGTVNVLALLVDESPAAPAAAPPPKAAPRSWLFPAVAVAAAAVVAAALVGGTVAVMHQLSNRDVAQATTAATEAPRPAVVPVVVPATAAPTAATPEPTVAAAPSAPVSVPVEAATRATAEPTAAPTATREPVRSHILLRVAHPLENGRLIVWIDGVLIYETKLRAEVSKKIVAIKFREGHVEQTLDVEPGRHAVKVEISWDDRRKDETTVADVTAGTTGVLDVNLARVTNDLSLEWNPKPPEVRTATP